MYVVAAVILTRGLQTLRRHSIQFRTSDEKEFIHQLPLKTRFEAAHYLCLRCKIIGCIMTIASFNVDDNKISGDDNIKVCIAADPGARGLVLEQ